MQLRLFFQALYLLLFSEVGLHRNFVLSLFFFIHAFFKAFMNQGLLGFAFLCTTLTIGQDVL